MNAKKTTAETPLQGRIAKMMEDRSVKGSRLNRSEVVTVRFDPRLSYFVELASRAQKRTRSSFIEWATEAALKEVALMQRDPKGGPSYRSLDELSTDLWSAEEWEQLVKLATYAPELMSIAEQKVWAIARDESWLWVKPEGPRNLANVDRKVFRRSWEDLKAVAAGDITESEFNKRAEMRA